MLQVLLKLFVDANETLIKETKEFLIFQNRTFNLQWNPVYSKFTLIVAIPLKSRRKENRSFGEGRYPFKYKTKTYRIR
jgi:hypothetical protein